MIARVRGVTAASTRASSMLSVSGLMSTNTGTPPRSTTALAVETKVKDGITTSSPGPMSRRSAGISSAAVHECVRSTAPALIRSLSQTWQRSV